MRFRLDPFGLESVRIPDTVAVIPGRKVNVVPSLEPVTFNRDSWANHYARRHLETDAAVEKIYYLPTDAPEREIRFLEINHDIMETPPEQPIDFGVDRGGDEEHKLCVLDVTPHQWELVQSGNIPLPNGWTLKGSHIFERNVP